MSTGNSERSWRWSPWLVAGVALCASPVSAGEGGLALPELVELARKNDLRVHEADAELRILRGKYDEAYWAWFPKFDTTLAVAGPTPEARNDAFGGPPTTAATRMYDLNLGRVGATFRSESSAVLPIYTFGKITALREAGEQGVQVGESLKKRAEDEAGLQTAQAYWGYQLARQGKETLGETLERMNEAGKLIRRLLEQESAQVTQIDQYKVDYFQKQVETKLGQAELGMSFASEALRLLSGLPEGSEGRIAREDLKNPSIDLKPVRHYLRIAEDSRPEVRAVAAGVAAREKEVFIRERLFLPDFGLGGFFRFAYTSSATRQLSPFAYDPYNDVSGGVALLAHSTFDIPVKEAQLEQARAELQKLGVQQRLLKSAIEFEVRKIHGELKDALERAQKFQDAEKSARRWATAAYANFEIGTGDTRELVDSFSAMAMASAEKLKSWHDAEVGYYGLLKAVGKNAFANERP